MADTTKIEWTDATWNPITGCSLASPGCTNCYAMGLAGTRLQHHPSRAGLTTMSKAGPVWNGALRFNEEWLTQPLKWKRPRKVFVCAHGDLFHESVPDAWIDRVFAVMALAPQHTFQVLTKRSGRMREYMTAARRPGAPERIVSALSRMYVDGAISRDPTFRAQRRTAPCLPNVWLGVSAEDQKRADERIPDLLATPAAVRWISAEPLLGPLNLRLIRIAFDHHVIVDALNGYAITEPISGRGGERTKLDWVVVGGESGPNARPMHPDWARSLRDQCAAAGVPFLFKQWGAWGIAPEYAAQDGLQWTYLSHDGRQLGSGAGREQGAFRMAKLGKTRAGRLLDGIEHNGYPEVR